MLALIPAAHGSHASGRQRWWSSTIDSGPLRPELPVRFVWSGGVAWSYWAICDLLGQATLPST